jgi:hypothetical protein
MSNVNPPAAVFGRRACVLLLFRLLLCPQLNSIEGRRDPPDPPSGLGKGVNIQDKLSAVVVIKYRTYRRHQVVSCG